MKKIFFFLLVGLVAVSLGQAQSIDKNQKVGNAGIGFGIYSIDDGDSTELTAATLFPVTFSYAPLKGLTTGLSFNLSNFIRGDDSSNTNIEEKVKAYTFRLNANYHFLNNDKFNMYAGAGGGYSIFTFDVTNAAGSNTFLRGGGFTYQFALGMQLFFTDNIGMFTQFSYDGYFYDWNLYVVDGYLEPLPPELSPIQLNGIEGKIGLVVKF